MGEKLNKFMERFGYVTGYVAGTVHKYAPWIIGILILLIFSVIAYSIYYH